MVKNRKLAKAINDVGWGQFVTLLTYKATWYGKNILKVNRFFASSKICSHCHHKLDNLPLSVRNWTCHVDKMGKYEHDSSRIHNRGLMASQNRVDDAQK